MVGVAGPLLFFSYGITKSGSTLAFELVRSALDSCGFNQLRLSDRAVQGPDKVLNFVVDIGAAQQAALLREAKELGYMVALKTHRAPSIYVKELLHSGEAIGHVVYRDPRDIALSMLDHGRKARSNGEEAFAKIESLDDTVKAITSQLKRLEEWVQLPGMSLIHYDDLAFNTLATCGRILEQLQLDGSAKEICRLVLEERFTQFNKGIPCRWKAEMTDFESARFLQEFSALYDLNPKASLEKT